MEQKSKEILMQILSDMEDFSNMKGLDYPPIYLLGGSCCIIGGYLNRATTDFDILDMEYDSKMGRLLRILDRYDLLDYYLTTIPDDFLNRAKKIANYKNVYILSREDIILSKIGRYSDKDIEDITKIMEKADKKLLKILIKNVLSRNDISIRIREEFVKNLDKFRERFDV